MEFFANNANDPGDYLIGEQFDLAKHQGFRRMDKPVLGRQLGGLLERHRRPARRALLLGRGQPLLLPALGGLGREDPERRLLQLADLQRLPASPGSATTRPPKIWYRALTVYMTSNTDYHGARTASLQAASDLYGAGSTQYAAVNAAWAGVNVS